MIAERGTAERELDEVVFDICLEALQAAQPGELKRRFGEIAVSVRTSEAVGRFIEVCATDTMQTVLVRIDV
jgi:hypothetical protein